MSRFRKILAASQIIFTLLFITSPAMASGGNFHVQTSANNSIERIFGETRYDTMFQIALKLYPGTVDNVILTTGIKFQDALAGVPLAHQKNAPILLVNKSPETSEQAFQYIKDHLNDDGKIYILGGTAIVPDSFITALTDLGFARENIIRLAGYTSYETSVEIAKQINNQGKEFFVASGDQFPDALSASVLAATTNMVSDQEAAYYKTLNIEKPASVGGVPILLIPSRGAVPDYVINYLNGFSGQGVELSQDLHIVGGTGVIPDSSLQQFKSQVKHLAVDGVTRTAGFDKYDTMGLLNKDSFDASWENNGSGIPVPQIFLSSGEQFPDALAGAVLAAREKAPLVLTNKNVAAGTADLLTYYYNLNHEGVNNGTKITIFGGTGVISSDTATVIDGIFNLGLLPNDMDQIVTLAGTGSIGLVDGNNSEAEFAFPSSVVEGSKGTIYVSDTSNNRIRAVLPEGKVITVAGTTNEKDSYGLPVGGFKDGSAEEAMFNLPGGIAVDPMENIYVADTGNGAIRVIDNKGLVKTLVQGLNEPEDVVIGQNNEIYVSETMSHRILKVTTDGKWSVLAGGGYEVKDGWLQGGYIDGKGEQAQFNEPTGLALETNGDLLVADKGNQRIRRITPAGEVTTVAGSGTELIPDTPYITGGFKNGPALEAQFNFPTGIAVDKNQNIYIADTYNHCIRIISNDGKVETYAGTGLHGKQNGLLAQAEFDGPSDLAILENGNIVIADQWNHLIRKIEIGK